MGTVSSAPPAKKWKGLRFIFEPKQLGLFSIFQLYGSVLPRCLIWAVFGGLSGGLMEGFQWSYIQHDSVWRHPYALHVFGMVLGFSLVIRIQIAYQRFWEGATMCHTASSKWADAIMQVMAFDEYSKDAFSDTALEFRSLAVHYASLMHACAMIDMRQDDAFDRGLFTLRQEDPFKFRANRADNSTLERGRRRNSAEILSPEEQLEIGGEPSKEPDKTAAADLSSQSERATTVPLQMLLRTRQQLSTQLNQTVKSFEAIDAVRARRGAPTPHRRFEPIFAGGTGRGWMVATPSMGLACWRHRCHTPPRALWQMEKATLTDFLTDCLTAWLTCD